MEASFWSPIVGWSAWLSAAATVVTLVTAALFFSRGGRWGPINDAASVVQVALMIPVALALPALLPRSALPLSIAAALVGLAGLILSGVGQGLLVLGRIDYPTSTRYMPAWIAIGVWLIASGAIALTGGGLPPLLSWIGVAAGAGYVVGMIGFRRGGQNDPLFYVGAAGMAIGYPAWAIWLGAILLGGG
jgi:hypothetical protein